MSKTEKPKVPNFKVVPPVSPNDEAVVFPQFYFTSEEAEREFWEQVEFGWPPLVR